MFNEIDMGCKALPLALVPHFVLKRAISDESLGNRHVVEIAILQGAGILQILVFIELYLAIQERECHGWLPRSLEPFDPCIR